MDAEQETVSIDLVDVLWRTRGKNWGYSFILKPERLLRRLPRLPDWYDIYQKLFDSQPDSDDEISRDFIYSHGDYRIPVVTTMFIDPQRRDSSDRSIPHYIAWFPVSEWSDARGRPKWKLDKVWGHQLLKSVASALDADDVFNRPDRDLKNEAAVAFRRHLEIDGPARITLGKHRNLGPQVDSDFPTKAEAPGGVRRPSEPSSQSNAGKLGVEFKRKASDIKSGLKTFVDFFIPPESAERQPAGGTRSGSQSPRRDEPAESSATLDPTLDPPLFSPTPDPKIKTREQRSKKGKESTPQANADQAGEELLE